MVKNNVQTSVFCYQSSFEDEDENTIIRLHCIQKLLDNFNQPIYKNVYIKVEGFAPYCYVELPSHIEWNDTRIKLVCDKLKMSCTSKNKPKITAFIKKRNYIMHIKKVLKIPKKQKIKNIMINYILISYYPLQI